VKKNHVISLLIFVVCLLAVPFTSIAAAAVPAADSNPKTVKRVLASENSLRLLPEESREILLHAVFSDGTVEDVTEKADWSSTNKKVAEATNGQILAKQTGTAVIVAVYNGKSDTLTVNVHPIKAVSRLKASTTKVKILPGENKQVLLQAVYRDKTVEDITTKAQWSSTNPEVARVRKGEVIGVSTGTAVLVANYGGKTKTLHVEVVTEKKVTKLTASPASLHLSPAASVQVILRATYEDKTTQDVVAKANWFSSDTNVAEVEHGLITAKATGKTKVYGNYGGKKAVITVHVK